MVHTWTIGQDGHLDAYFTTNPSGTSSTLEWIPKCQNENQAWFSGRLFQLMVRNS